MDDGGEMDSAFMMTPSKTEQLKELLQRTRTRMILKPHPLSIHCGRENSTEGNLWAVSDDWIQERGLTLYEALGQMDGLLTDVSSVYVDYLVLNRPILFFFPDLEAYRQSRGFVHEPVEEWLPGRLCTTVEQLLAELADFADGKDAYRAIRSRLADLLNPQRAPGATARLFELVAEDLGGHGRPGIGSEKLPDENT
jgi:CDP-glycerol glycerophosphotransferase (TagB/SpsB family)